MLAAVLLGAAVAVLLGRPRAARRLRALAPDPCTSSGAERRAPGRGVVLVGAGLVCWLLVGGWPGLALGGALAVLGPRGLAWLDAANSREDDISQHLPLALDLVGACLAGGGALSDTLTLVAKAVSGPCGSRLDRVASALLVGTPPYEAFRELGDSGAAGSAARALCRASEGGTPVAAAVSRVAQESRRAAALAARTRAKRAGVMAVGPLGLCFLPAFLLIGVVPVIAGMLGPLLSSL
jgi:Flp pilus assembly protein TadB